MTTGAERRRLTSTPSSRRSRSHDRFLVVTHESPDGDALGSMLGATLGAARARQGRVMYLGGELPLPGEYGFLPLAEVLREPPADLETRVLLALDCANERRLGPDPALLARAALVVDVDHHHDNSRFGAVNLVVADASSTAEIVGDLLAALGVALEPRDRRGALRRPRHRHRPLPVLQHDAQGAALRRRARRGGRRRQRASSSTSTRRSQFAEAEAARARARARRAARRRAPARLAPAARRLRRASARRSRTPTGSSTSCARPRAPRSSR